MFTDTSIFLSSTVSYQDFISYFSVSRFQRSNFQHLNESLIDLDNWLSELSFLSVTPEIYIILTM
uniref:Uncharacterized protein n=1 Tax=Octopus bimaculoides TaxID=37653 RepID=A0A0L8G1C5_OCTBM